MINLLSLIFQNEASPSNTCTPDMENIQGCISCDGECLYSCDAMCADICTGSTEGGTDNTGGSDCNTICTARCLGCSDRCKSTAFK